MLIYRTDHECSGSVFWLEALSSLSCSVDGYSDRCCDSFVLGYGSGSGSVEGLGDSSVEGSGSVSDGVSGGVSDEGSGSAGIDVGSYDFGLDLSDYPLSSELDLVCVLLGVSREVGVRLLRRYGSLAGVVGAPEISSVAGVGRVAVSRWRALRECLFRLVSRVGVSGVQICGPDDVWSLVAPVMSVSSVELIYGIALNAKNRVIGIEELSRGTVDSSLITPREVFGWLVGVGAAAWIICHNHPSGDPNPSPEDIAFTRRLREAGNLMYLPLIDHVIIGRNNYCSLRAMGHL